MVHSLTPNPSPTAAGEGSTPEAVPPRLAGGRGGQGVRERWRLFMR